MRLTVEDIERLNREVEETEVRALKRYMENLEHEAVTEFRHGDWGDRD